MMLKHLAYALCEFSYRMRQNVLEHCLKLFLSVGLAIASANRPYAKEKFIL